MKELISYIEKSITLTDQMKHDLTAIATVKNIVKGEMVLKERSSRKIQVFVASGCLRSFYRTDSGKDHTLQFAISDWWIGDYMTLFKSEAAIMNVESLSHSKIIIFEQDELERLSAKHPKLGNIQRKGLENRIATLQRRILGLLTLTAREKYLRFVNEYEVFEQIIPNYQIASYLGITPESLSRVRKELATM